MALQHITNLGVLEMYDHYRGPWMYEYSRLVSRCQTQPSAMKREGSSQPTVLPFVKSLARFFGYFSG